ncbi:MAG: Transcriptional regulator, TetR family [Solirubrobacteraceae bacterium]|nr:Transcriptional regulator, TetR family [Solirubrobacteraceae bacterium]
MAEILVGLRETKKARTRLAISDAATKLFWRHGFEHVTVTEIAAAADVSVKTVFNYFATKEDLFFDRADELLGGLVRAVTDRPAGTTVIASLHALLADNMVPFSGEGWAGIRDPTGYERFRGFVATEQAAPALRARRLVIAESWIARLAPVLAGELGLRADDRRAHLLASLVIGVMGTRERTLSAAILDGVAPRTVERRVRAVVDEAFGRLAVAFADVDRAAET